MTGRRLRVRTRPKPKAGSNTQNWTLFARLSSQTARTLCDGHSDEAPQFLPLCLNGKGLGNPLYVSYNGGCIQEEDCIEVAAGTVPENITHVTVSVAPNLSDAVSVEVEPLTTSDWESLEVHAQVLEDGGLLQQVSVVYPQQVLLLKVAGSEIAQVRVHTEAPCRLLANTEVHVRPKPRKRIQSLLLSVMPSWDDYSAAMQRLARESDEEYKQIRVPPCTALVHPRTLEKCRAGHESIVTLRKESSVDKGMAVARLESSELVVEDSIVLHKLLRYELNVSPLFDSVRIESEAAFDSSEAVEMVSCGSLALSLERVNFILTDHDSLWRAPEEVPPRPLWLDSSKERTPYSVQLHSIMASWLDDLDITKHVPLRSGSLFAVSEKKSQGDHPNEQIYRLVTHLMSVDQEHADTESVYVAAKDLPHLLLKSCSVVSQLTPVDFNNEQKGLSLSKQELSLNLLPPISDITIDESINASNLCGDIACFDSIILIGDLGSGKTHAALMLGARARVIKEYGTLYLDCKRLQSSCDVRMKDILQALTDIFNEAIQAVRSCVIILDDIDKLIPNVTMGGEEDGSAHQQQPNPVAIDQAKLLADHLNRLIEDACTESKKEKPFVMMTARDDQSIHPTIATRFHRTVNVPSFNGRDREELFATMLRNSMGKGTLIRIGTADLHDFGKRTEGFRPRDLAVVATRVSLILDGSESHDLNLMEAVNSRLKGYVPISLQGVRAHDTTCSVAWSQIGGLFGAKEYLSSSILRPVKYRRIYQHSPIRLPRGIVLYGPPGCGKSFLVPALAKECGLTLVTCRGPELLDKYIGASEAKVRQLFHRAYAASPSLLFLDEFDALAPVRGSDHTGVTDRVVNQLLTYLDGVEDAAIGAVYIIAATSRPDKVDPALLRPGRLEQHVYVGFPTSIEEWHSISEQSLSGHSIDSHLQDVIEKRKLLEAPCLAHALSFSPADIKAVVDTAYLNAVHEFLASSDEVMEGSQNEPVVIEMHHMVNALQTTRPSLSINDRRMLEQAYRPFMSATDRPEDEHDTESTGQKRLKTALK